ncbi:MAG: adenylyl-sulfate kinase [Phycisphaerales bacterium]|nr:adenylyl-sulfate kinase [Phycisphaerales bacterium]
MLTRAERFARLGCVGKTLWMTGLSGSGKSTVAAALERALVDRGVHAYRLDGDNLRHGLNRDLGFSPEHRSENIRRIGEVAKLMAESGCVVIVSVISPYRADRDACRAMHERDAQGSLGFIEVFVDAPLAVCEERDPKGLYRKARAGEITGMTGLDAPYEPPMKAELVLRTAELGVEACVGACVSALGVSCTTWKSNG